jgi:hypothetical protein
VAKVFATGKTYGDMHGAGVLLGVAARNSGNSTGLGPIQDWFRNPIQWEALAAKATPTISPILSGTVATAAAADLTEAAAEFSDWLSGTVTSGFSKALTRLAGVVAEGAGAAAIGTAAVIGTLMVIFAPPAGNVVEGTLSNGIRYRWDGPENALHVTVGDRSVGARKDDDNVFRDSNGVAIARLINNCVVIDQTALEKAITGDIVYQKPPDKPPKDAKDPNGAKAPGKPGAKEGFQDPKTGEKWAPNPYPDMGASSAGWLDDQGRVWCPTGPGGLAHGGPHWDVQIKGSRSKKGVNIKPGQHIDKVLSGDNKGNIASDPAPKGGKTNNVKK